MNTQIQVIPFEDMHHDRFREINLEWLDKYALREPRDMVALNDPKGEIIDKGGYIWVALSGDVVVGTSALIKEHDGVYELAKMCVSPEWRGKGISKILIEVCLNKARELHAEKVELYSNHQLVAALKLYEQYGFKYIEVTDSPFETADIKMELTFGKVRSS